MGWRYGRLWQCDLEDTERCHDSGPGVFQLLVHYIRDLENPAVAISLKVEYLVIPRATVLSFF